MSYVDAIAQRFGDGGPSAEGVADNEFIRRVLARKTVRRYSATMPEESLLDLLVAAALSASAKSDFQQASILRVTDPASAPRSARCFPPCRGSARRRCSSSSSAMRGGCSGSANCAASRCATARSRASSTPASMRRSRMQTMILCAEAAGLGVCPISVIRNEIDKVAAILDLPDLVFPVAGLCLGYPQGEGYVSLRLPRGATTARDRYDDSALPQAIDDYDRRRDARHSIPQEQHRSNAEFGEAAFYGWSEDKARQAAKAEGAAFPPYLRAHGFTFD